MAGPFDLTRFLILSRETCAAKHTIEHEGDRVECTVDSTRSVFLLSALYALIAVKGLMVPVVGNVRRLVVNRTDSTSDWPRNLLFTARYNERPNEIGNREKMKSFELTRCRRAQCWEFPVFRFKPFCTPY